MPITGGGAGTSLPRGIRERYADFLADLGALNGASITRRPDAISFDYLTAFTVGPIALGDTSDGIVSWVWRVRCDATTVYAARENATRDGWLAETVVFVYGGSAIDELDVCFDQNGQAVIVAERASTLWIYYNDVTLGGYGFRNFGAGRTPRAVLDDPLDVVGSDVLVFFVDPVNGVVYRQQRDRYATVYPTTPDGTNPVPVPDAPGVNYGPVLFTGTGDTLTTGIPVKARFGNITITMGDGHAFPVGSDYHPTERFAVSPAHGIASMGFSELVYGFSVEITNLLYPQWGGGSVHLSNGGLHVATVDFTTPVFPSDPVGHATFNFPAGFDAMTFLPPAADHQAYFQNLFLYLHPAQIDAVKANVCSHGPVVFAYTGDPTIISGTVDGITVTVTNPLDIIDSVAVDPSSLLYGVLAHQNTPGVFTPMAWDDIERPYGYRHDPDGVRIQPGAIQPVQLTSGNNRNVQGTDLVLTFSSVVDGVEIEAVPSPWFTNYMVAYNAAGAQIARVQLYPPVAFAPYSNPYRIFAPGIKSLRLVPAIGDPTIAVGSISWTNLKFKKPGDLPVGGGGTVPVPPQVFPPAPPVPKTDVFLEDAVRTPDGRVSVIYSVRDAATGTYSFGRIDTVLYPYHAPFDGEAMIASVGTLNGLLFQLIVDYFAPYDFEGMTASYGLTPGGIAALINASATVITHPQPWTDEAMTAFLTVPSGILFLVIHDWDQYYDLEGMTAVIGAIPGAALVQIVFEQFQPYVDEGMTAMFGVLPTGNSLV